MADNDTETVFVRSSGTGEPKSVYHTDPECPRLKTINSVMEKPLSVFNGDIDECQYCSGEYVVASPGEQSHLASLKRAAEEGY